MSWDCTDESNELLIGTHSDPTGPLGHPPGGTQGPLKERGGIIEPGVRVVT